MKSIRNLIAIHSLGQTDLILQSSMLLVTSIRLSQPSKSLYFSVIFLLDLRQTSTQMTCDRHPKMGFFKFYFNGNFCCQNWRLTLELIASHPSELWSTLENARFFWPIPLRSSIMIRSTLIRHLFIMTLLVCEIKCKRYPIILREFLLGCFENSEFGVPTWWPTSGPSNFFLKNCYWLLWLFSKLDGFQTVKMLSIDLLFICFSSEFPFFSQVAGYMGKFTNDCKL